MMVTIEQLATELQQLIKQLAEANEVVANAQEKYDRWLETNSSATDSEKSYKKLMMVGIYSNVSYLLNQDICYVRTDLSHMSA